MHEYIETVKAFEAARRQGDRDEMDRLSIETDRLEELLTDEERATILADFDKIFDVGSLD